MAEEQNAQAAAGAEQAQDQLQFALQRIYVKDVSFEAPNSPAVFSQPFQPKVALELDTEHQQVGEELFEVSIKVTAQVTNGEDKTTAFLAEVEQAGLFRIAGLSAEQLEAAMDARLPKAERQSHPRDHEDARCAAVGNSSSIPVTAWLLQELFCALSPGRPRLSLEMLVHRCTPRCFHSSLGTEGCYRHSKTRRVATEKAMSWR